VAVRLNEDDAVSSKLGGECLGDLDADVGGSHDGDDGRWRAHVLCGREEADDGCEEAKQGGPEHAANESSGRRELSKPAAAASASSDGLMRAQSRSIERSSAP
jgi:hypothetical protein